MRMCLHFKIQLALPRFILFFCKLPFLVLFLPNLIGKLEPGMWVNNPSRHSCVARQNTGRASFPLTWEASLFLRERTGLRQLPSGLGDFTRRTTSSSDTSLRTQLPNVMDTGTLTWVFWPDSECNCHCYSEGSHIFKSCSDDLHAFSD